MPGSHDDFAHIGPSNTAFPEEELFIPQFAVEAARIGTWQRNLVTGELIISSVLGRIVGLPERQARITAKAW